MTNERRLIEEYLPVRAVSYEATREKLLRKRDYHLSMLHLWWARRPLAAARAAVYATLVEAEGRAEDPERVQEFMAALCRWGGMYGSPVEAVAQACEHILAEAGGEAPKILDCFAGGGAIPLEVGRLGGQAYALELNPVAYLILLCTLVYPQTFGPSLADDIDKWGAWLRERARADIGELYPEIGADDGQLSFDGSLGKAAKGLIPVAYLWTRTVPCPNPALPSHELDLVRQTWLVKKPGKGGKAGKFVALRPIVDRAKLAVRYEVVSASTADGLGFDPEHGSERGDAACSICGAALTANQVRLLGKQGKMGHRLMAVAAVRRGSSGKQYLSSAKAEDLVPDGEVVQQRLATLVAESGLTIPDTPLSTGDTRKISPPLYGLGRVGDLFTTRQLIALLTFCRHVREAHTEMLAGGMDPTRAKAVATFLAMAVDRVADRGSSLCHWDNSRETTANTYARQALPMVWDFSETNPFSGSSGDLAWLQRSIGHLYPEHLAGPTTPKRKEIVAVPYRFGSQEAAKGAYDDMMAEVFARRREELKPGAPLVVVYAHKTYAGWATLVNALRRAGFVVVEAWPLDTEMPTRSVGQGTASLASSIFLVARRRESDGVGDWSVVHRELQEIVGERVRSLPDMGVAGDDLVIAAIGAGLRAYTRYGRVELPNGEELPPERYLEEVQREVIEAILADIFRVAKSGITAVDESTQFYVMGRFEFGTSWVEFDRANTLGKGVGVEMSGPRSLLKGRRALLEQEKGKVCLRDFLDRGGMEALGRPEDGAPPTLIDVLHRMLWLAERQPRDLRDFLLQSGADPDRLRLVAQALSGGALSKKGVGTSPHEHAAIASLLGSWKHLVEENLLWRRS